MNNLYPPDSYYGNPYERDEYDIELTQWEQLDDKQRDSVIDTLTDKANDDLVALVWVSNVETRVISASTATLSMAEDVMYAKQILEAVMAGDDKGEELLSKCREIVREQVDEAMADYQHLPDGFTWREVLNA